MQRVPGQVVFEMELTSRDDVDIVCRRFNGVRHENANIHTHIRTCTHTCTCHHTHSRTCTIAPLIVVTTMSGRGYFACLQRAPRGQPHARMHMHTRTGAGLFSFLVWPVPMRLAAGALAANAFRCPEELSDGN